MANLELLANRASKSIHYNKKDEPTMMCTSLADIRLPDKTQHGLIGATRNTTSCKKNPTPVLHIYQPSNQISGWLNGVLSKSREQIHPQKQEE
jgi:hypothetical protein